MTTDTRDPAHQIKQKSYLDTITKGEVSTDLWLASEPVIVLGRTSDEARDVAPKAREDGVTIVRRPGGGGTVLLDDGVLVFDVAAHTRRWYPVEVWFRGCNRLVLKALASLGVEAEMDMKWFDLRCEGRKFGGVSLFTRGSRTLYGTSLIIREDTINHIANYLQEPERQPEYRRLRKHRDFLVALQRLPGFELDRFMLELRQNVEGLTAHDLAELGR